MTKTRNMISRAAAVLPKLHSRVGSAVFAKPTSPSAHKGRTLVTLLMMLLTTATAWAEDVATYYVDENGTSHDVTATVLTWDMDNLGTDGQTTWYVVNGVVNTKTENTFIHGNVNIILADGCVYYPGHGSGSYDGFRGTGNLTFYGQTAGTGTAKSDAQPFMYELNGDVTVCSGNIDIPGNKENTISLTGTFTVLGGSVSVTTDNGYHNVTAIKAGTVDIRGGSVDVRGPNAIKATTVNISGGTVWAYTNGGDTGGGVYGYAIECTTFNFSGGNVTAGYTSCEDGQTRVVIDASNINLSWTSPTDRIRAEKEKNNDNVICYFGTVTIAQGKPFKVGSTTYMGTLTSEQKAAIAGQTLEPDLSLAATGDGSAAHPYYINATETWNDFCDAIEDGESFSGKTVKLGANITVSSIAGSGNGGDLTTSDRPFCGTFDGQGNTLTFNYGSSSNPADENNLAPFRYVNNATIQHLHVSGDIYTQHVHAGGIVGMAYGTTNITDCRSSVNIVSSINGDGTHGGIMSCSWTGSTTNITGCVFDGSIQSASGYATDQCGGFVGWRNATINVTNSLLTADLSTIATPDGLQYPSATFVRNGSAGTNCYYTRTLGTAQGKAPRTVTAGENVTISGISPVGSPVENGTYSVSGITAYAKGITRTVDDVTTFYYGLDDEVSLTFDELEGYSYEYTTSGGTLSGTENPYTLTMPDADVTITRTWKKLITNSSIRIDDIPNQTFNGSAICPPVSVTYGDEQLDQDTDYTVEYANNVNVGTATATITGIGNYTGSVEKTFEIVYDIVTTSYVDADGTTVNNVQAIPLLEAMTTLPEGNYLATGTLNYTDGITLNGDITLILEDGCEMNANGGIVVSSGNSLTIYAQSDGSSMGVLNAEVPTSDGYSAGIGGSNGESCGTVTINGGDITARGGYNGAGIGGGSGGSGGTIVINGGTVKAYGSCTSANDGGGAGIGGGTGGAAGNITINGGTVTARGNWYVPGIGGGINGTGGNITINGGKVTAEGGYDGDNGIKGTIILGWTNATDRIYASSYVGTVSVATTDGKKLHNGSKFLSGNVSDLADINGKTLRPAANATYTTADGTAAEPVDAILLDGSDNSLPAGNYLATGTLNYTDGITLTGNVTLILADNCHMNVGTSGERINGSGINGFYYDALDWYDLTITSEANGSGNGNGALSVYNNSDGIIAGTLTINGGNITADTDADGAPALGACRGDLTINSGTVNANTAGTDAPALFANGNFNYNGGNVTATAPDDFAICADVGNYTFSWRTPADRITIGATGLYAPAAKTATFSKAFIDEEGNIYSGTLTGSEALALLAGKTLTAYTPTEGYYFVGNMTNWGLNANKKLTINPANTEEYMIQNVALTTADQFKVVYYDANTGNWSWFPEGTGNNYGEKGEISADGIYDIYFRPNYDGGNDWFYQVIFMTPSTVNVTFAPEGFATYYHSMYDIELPAGVKARIVTAKGDAEGTLTYETIADGDTDNNKVVPAGIAVMLQTEKSTEPQQKTLTFGIHGENSPAAPAQNYLHGQDYNGLTTGDGKHYKLTYGNDNTPNADVFGWYWGAAEGAAFSIAGHKAWLVLPYDQAGAPNFLALPDNDVVTSLREKGIVNSEQFATAAQWYTIDGMKLASKPTAKGVYIHNGKKVVVK